MPRHPTDIAVALVGADAARGGGATMRERSAGPTTLPPRKIAPDAAQAARPSRTRRARIAPIRPDRVCAGIVLAAAPQVALDRRRTLMIQADEAVTPA